jgi:hypothetical protein
MSAYRSKVVSSNPKSSTSAATAREVHSQRGVKEAHAASTPSPLCLQEIRYCTNSPSELLWESFVDESFKFKEGIYPNWGVKSQLRHRVIVYRPARLHGLTGRYDNSMPELTLSSSHGSVNLATVQQNIHVVIGHALSMLEFYYLQLSVCDCL